jgi:hypothetical protein
MSDPQVAMWLILMGAFETVAVIIALFVVFPSEGVALHILQKIGFAFLVSGLVVQLVRSSHYLQFGIYPVDVLFPTWITKDIGACILVYYYAFVAPKDKG